MYVYALLKAVSYNDLSVLSMWQENTNIVIDNSKQSGGGQASISQRHRGSDVLTRISSEKQSMSVMGFQKKFGRGWVGGVSSIQVFSLGFLDFF